LTLENYKLAHFTHKLLPDYLGKYRKLFLNKVQQKVWWNR